MNSVAPHIAHKAIEKYETKQGTHRQYITMLFCDLGYELYLYAMEQYHIHHTPLQETLPSLHATIQTLLNTVKRNKS